MAIARISRTSELLGLVADPKSTGGGVAASTVDSKAHPRFAIWGLLLVSMGAVGGWILFRWWDPVPFQPASDYSVFAGLFVVAAAVERLLEPFSPYVGPDTSKTKQELEHAVANAMDPSNPADPKDAADKQEQLNRERSERAFLLWGVATLVATILCAGLGMLLLRSVTDEPMKDPNRFLDLAITGLVVGAGTKPLHDLISRLQKAKENATDPAETTG